MHSAVKEATPGPVMAVPESNHKGVSSLASSYAAVVSMDVDVQKGRLLKDKCLLERTVLDIEVTKQTSK